MITGKLKYLPPRFMTVKASVYIDTYLTGSLCLPSTLQVNTAIEQLLEVEDTLKGGVLSGSTKAVGMARLGQTTQKVINTD